MATLQHTDDRAEIHRLVVGPLDNNVFVLRCRASGEAILIDAANEHERLLGLCRALGVRSVVQTHGHWDHVQAVPNLRAAGYPVAVAAADAPMLDGHDAILEDDSVIAVGELALRTIATPGHTPGSMSFHLDGSSVLFSGDTLFPGGPGRTDGNERRFATIIRSIEERLFPLPAETVVLPGHGEATTIDAERPHLREWVDRGW